MFRSAKFFKTQNLQNPFFFSTEMVVVSRKISITGHLYHNYSRGYSQDIVFNALKATVKRLSCHTVKGKEK